MKRSPLRRGTKPLKRSGPIKRGKPLPRRRKKPRPYMDRDVISRFSDLYLKDELERFCRGPIWTQVCAGHVLFSRVETHHIFHNTRNDLWHNFVRGTSRAHRAYGHEREPIGLNIASMLSVAERTPMFLKGGTVETDDRALYLADVKREWALCRGGHCAVEWMEGKEKDVPEYYTRLYRRLMRAFR